jgi:hypothetical protein
MTMRRHWTDQELSYLDSLGGEYPIDEIVSRYNKKAEANGWPQRTKKGLRTKLNLLGYKGNARTGEWLTSGGVAEILGCPSDRVTKWLINASIVAIVCPVYRAGIRYVTREGWRRLARQRPEVLGGYSADRLYQLLEDKTLANAVASLYPRQLGDHRIRCLEDGRVWPSAGAAAKDFHVSREAIRDAMEKRRPVRCIGRTFVPLLSAPGMP